jgi:hypothetical protein
MQTHRVVFDRSDLTDYPLSVRAALLLLFMDPEPLLLKFVEVFKFTLPLSDN